MNSHLYLVFTVLKTSIFEQIRVHVLNSCGFQLKRHTCVNVTLTLHPQQDVDCQTFKIKA